MSAKGTSKRRIPMTVTFLEMTAKPAALPPPQPKGKVALLRCEKPSAHFYRYLYDTIGDGLFLGRPQASLTPDGAGRGDPGSAQPPVMFCTRDGTPAGMAELDLRKAGTANISYFGLMPEAIGKRLGYFFLYHTCMNAWAQPIQRLTVNTCTLDHPRALPLYQRMGFSPMPAKSVSLNCRPEAVRRARSDLDAQVLDDR